MQKGFRRSDALPIVLLCLTWLCILIIWGVNALPRAAPPHPETESARVASEIRGAGLEPREASHYRILPDDQEQR